MLEQQEATRISYLQKLAATTAKRQGNFLESVMAQKKQREQRFENQTQIYVERLEKAQLDRFNSEKESKRMRNDQMIKVLAEQQAEMRLRAQREFEEEKTNVLFILNQDKAFAEKEALKKSQTIDKALQNAKFIKMQQEEQRKDSGRMNM